jgi:hypothetical protein
MIPGRTLVVAAAFLALGATAAGAGHWPDCHPVRGVIHGDVEIDFEDDMLVLTHDDHPGESVEITAEGELYVNGERVRTDTEERRLLRDFYDHTEDIRDHALAVGREGARIGLKGAGLAVKALAKVIKLLSPDYDADDLEAEMELEAEKIEREAEALEERAEVIEEWADELEDLSEELRDRIPALREVAWL